MPYALNGLRTSDQYEDNPACEMSTPGGVGARVMVEWAPVYIQIAPSDAARGESWEPEVLFNRGYHPFARNLSRIRVRSALASMPALVTIEVVKNYE